jgi:DNA mismatch endonuclease (patch repair protein)
MYDSGCRFQRRGQAMDTLSSSERSKQMGLVRSKDTKPEIAVRRLVHSLGYRYRLHVRKLPGSPDLVFSGRRKVIFVHGCFWHRHPRCKNTRLPKSRVEFWETKLRSNRERDLKNQRKLRRLGWRYLVLWECQIRDTDTLTEQVVDFLEDRHNEVH